MAKEFVHIFRAADIAVQTAENVAYIVLTVAGNKSLKGKAILAIQGRAWDFEEGLDHTITQWLGEVPVSMIEETVKGWPEVS